MDGKKVSYDLDKTIFEYFDQNILKNDSYFNKTAILYKTKSLTFGQVQSLIVSINQFIYSKLSSNHSNRKNPYIGIHLIPDENTIPVLLAINSLSFCYLPIDPKLPFERMKYIINDAKPMIIITNSNDSKIKEITEENSDILLIDLKDILSNDSSLDINSFEFDLKNACLLYTSGSTGVPKGVLLTNSSIMNRLHWQWEEFNLDETDIGTFKTSFNFVDHISEIFAFILKGLPIIVIDPEITSSSIEALINLLYENRVTYFVLVPSLLRNILIFTKATKNYFKLKNIKRWVCSGEKLSRDLLDLFFEISYHLEIKPVISNFYGSTEVTADVTFITFYSKEQVINQTLSQSDVPIGIPISNSKVFLFDENMTIIDCDDKIGEIYAGGLCLARGYLKDANQTNKFIQINNETLFKTGDFGYFHNSLLYYSGRVDSQIKINGKRVDLSELEYNSTKINGIKSFVPLVYEDFIIAFYESDLDLLTEQINELIIEHFKSCVYVHMIPIIHNLIRIESIPLLYNGKIDKQKLKNLYKENYQGLKSKSNLDLDHPQSVKEKILNCIQKITGVYSDSDHLNLSFDKLGINSLNYVEIFFELNKIFDNKLNFNHFITIKSINELLDKTVEKTVPTSNYRLFRFSEDPNYSFLVLNMFLKTFSIKSSLLTLYLNDSNEKNTRDCFYPMADYLKNSDLCFIVYDIFKEKYVGGCFIYDYFNDDPPCTIVNDLYFHLLDLLGSTSKKVSDRDWFQNKKVLHSSIVTTSPETTQEENVMIIKFIEEQIVNVANEFNFDAILTSNTSQLTKDVTVKMNQYVVEYEDLIRNYEYNGNKYFSKIDESELISICVKYLK